MTHPELDRFIRPDICGPCGGDCCKRLPGIASPEDFGLPNETRLREAIASGRWAIDWYEGDPRDDVDWEDPDCISHGYYVRPATEGKEGQVYDGSWGGQCTFLMEDGCSLPYEDRPYGCKTLEPMEGGGAACVSHGFGKREAAIAWLPHLPLLTSFEPAQ